MTCLSFDDVLLVPVKSEVKSRRDPDISTFIAGFKLEVPLISSPMDTVTDGLFAEKMSDMGGLGIVHRFLSPEKQLKELIEIESGKTFSFAVGVGDAEYDRFRYIYDNLNCDSIVTVDVANGHSTIVEKAINKIKMYAPEVKVIAGSVATADGFVFLANCGADAVRVGIGGGSICKTRIMTGFGLPTLHSVTDCYMAKRTKGLDNVSIIADGGIRYPSDVVKSIVAGADGVICGRIFAETFESCGRVTLGGDGNRYKHYRGMASREVQEERRGGLKEGTCAEGVQTRIQMRGSVRDIFSEFSGGLRSAMTYANANSLSELRANSRFVRITGSGIEESHSFGTRR